MPALRRLFPHVRSCILSELVVQYRRVWRRRYRKRGFRLEWPRPGVVWAIDHSEACYPVDGVYPYLLAVRDLGSSQQLAWHPCCTERAEEVAPVLESLFQEHGPPLVLKSDNGSAFIAEAIEGQLASRQVAHLRSPPRTPSYNGALERSNGTLKTYTQLHASREGRALRWTTDDLEQARLLANEITRPRGADGPTPEQAWEDREPLILQERREFAASLAEHRKLFTEKLGVAVDKQECASANDAARINRHAIRSALVDNGYLIMHRACRAPQKPKRLSTQDLNHAALERVSSAPGNAQEKLAMQANSVTMQTSSSRSASQVVTRTLGDSPQSQEVHSST